MRHALLLLVTVVVAAIAWTAGPPEGALDRLSLATAWLCFALLTAALVLGPRARLRNRRPLVNSPLRRDLGIWAALTGMAHLGAATGEVMQPAYFLGYVTGPVGDPLPAFRNWISTPAIVAGYLVGLLFLMLLGLSNDWSLKRLGAARWKQLQSASLLAFYLTVAHGLVFQVLEGRTRGWLAALVVASAGILLLRYRAGRVVAAGSG